MSRKPKNISLSARSLAHMLDAEISEEDIAAEQKQILLGMPASSGGLRPPDTADPAFVQQSKVDGPALPVADSYVANPTQDLSPALTFESWIRSKEGLDCTNPWIPADRIRLVSELENRLRKAWVAAARSLVK